MLTKMTRVKISKNCFYCVIKHDNFTLCQKSVSKKVYYLPANHFLFQVSGFLKSNVKVLSRNDILVFAKLSIGKGYF